MSISKKKFFRHLRGELNGYYLQSVSYFINNWTDDNYNKLFAYFKNMQFRMDSANELENISSEDLRNLAKFAGVTQLLTRKTLATNILRMTNTHEVNGIEYSERGLWDRENEIFKFFHTGDYSDDIVNVATSDLQMSMVPDGQAVLGYIAEGMVMYDTDGVFHPERLLSEPPATGAYVEYYGDKFLQLGENYIVSSNAPDRLIYEMLVLIQKIHYQGASVKTFAEMTNILVGDFVKLGSQTRHTRYVEWSYVNDETVETTNRTIKLMLWRSLVEQFFQQIVLTEAGA